MSDSRVCPECNVGLNATVYAGVNFEVCPRCMGHWFDYLCLRRLQNDAGNSMGDLDAAPASAVGNVAPGSLKCPACSTQLETYRYLLGTGIQPEVCHHCGGIWIRHGDLLAMATATQQARAEAFRQGSRLVGEQFVTFPSDVTSKLETHPGVRYDVPPTDLDHPMRGAPDSLKSPTTAAANEAIAAIAELGGDAARAQSVSQNIREVSRALSVPVGVSSLPWLFSGGISSSV